MRIEFPQARAKWSLWTLKRGHVLRLALDDNSRRQYTQQFDNYADEIRKLAQRNGGSYVALPSSTSLEEAIFGSLVRTEGVA